MTVTTGKTPTAATNDGSGTAWAPWAADGTLPEGMQMQTDGKAPYVSGASFTSQGLMAYDFDFAIPSDATVTGIECIVRAKHGSATITAKVTQLYLRNSGGEIGDNRYAGSQPTLSVGTKILPKERTEICGD